MRHAVAMREDLGAEAAVYKALSDLYVSPGENLLHPELLAALRRSFAELGLDAPAPRIEEMERFLAGLADATEVAAEYVRLFRGPTKAIVYPYESMHVDGEIMGPSALAVLASYQAAGLGLPDEPGELPDHISTELEFMYYLASAEARQTLEGNQAATRRFRQWRRAFLRDHLAGWVPGFAEMVVQNTHSLFYYDLAKITNDFVCAQDHKLKRTASGPRDAGQEA